MSTNANDMAFPVTFPVDMQPTIQLGLTKREYFAALAMQAILSNAPVSSSYANSYVKSATVFADMLIAELSKVQS